MSIPFKVAACRTCTRFRPGKFSRSVGWCTGDHLPARKPVAAEDVCSRHQFPPTETAAAVPPKDSE